MEIRVAARRIVASAVSPFFKFQRRFPLPAFILRRMVVMVVMLFFLGLGVFALISAVPGDIVSQVIQAQLLEGSNVTAEQEAAMRSRLGLDQPFFVQYFRWLGRALQGDLGVGLVSRAPVTFLMWQRLLNTLLLNTISLVVVTTLSLTLAIYFSTKAGTRTDVAVTFIALTLHAVPGLLILILVQLFAAVTGLFPVTGFPNFSFASNPGAFVGSYIHHTFLLVAASFLGGIGGSLRSTRALMLDQLGQPYITSLRTRGVAEWRVFFLHAFRNILNPIITGTAFLLAGLFGGSIVLETIFAFPGRGLLTFQAVQAQDVNLVMANLMFISALLMIGMALADVLLAVFDPRIRYGKS
ncbi:MAG: ABC transporter permease [Treponema sp.]|nr:ABC transporter permease [Treponema sp.]